MRFLFPLLLVATSVFASNDEPSSDRDRFRVSFGLGGGTAGFAGDARLLVGFAGSDWSYGVQSTGFSELKLFTSPNENVSSWNLLAAREFSPTGPCSVLLFAGAGVARTERRGEVVVQEMFMTRYESIRSLDPTVLLGLDLGAAYRRVVGLSLQTGVQVSRISAAYATLQFDLGSW